MKILVNFFANVNEKSVNDLIGFVTQNVFAAQNQKLPLIELELVIQIASSGGSSDHGLLAYNYLKQLNIKKTTINMGNVDSAAVMIFCAGDQRYTTETSRFTLHGSITTLQGAFNGEKLYEIADLNKRITDDYIKVVHQVTGQKISKLTKDIKAGSVIDASMAVKLKLATEMINEPYIKTTDGVNAIIINNAPIQLSQANQQQIIQN